LTEWRDGLPSGTESDYDVDWSTGRPRMGTQYL
jgi:hypothetical protein